MYVFKVTHIPTRKFYISTTTESKRLFNPAHNQDPVGEFEPLGHNGARRISNIEKRIIQIAGTLEEMSEIAANIVKNYENNESFLGYKPSPNSPLLNAPPIEPKEKPKPQKNEKKDPRPLKDYKDHKSPIKHT